MKKIMRIVSLILVLSLVLLPVVSFADAQNSKAEKFSKEKVRQEMRVRNMMKGKKNENIREQIKDFKNKEEKIKEIKGKVQNRISQKKEAMIKHREILKKYRDIFRKNHKENKMLMREIIEKRHKLFKLLKELRIRHKNGSLNLTKEQLKEIKSQIIELRISINKLNHNKIKIRTLWKDIRKNLNERDFKGAEEKITKLIEIQLKNREELKKISNEIDDFIKYLNKILYEKN